MSEHTPLPEGPASNVVKEPTLSPEVSEVPEASRIERGDRPYEFGKRFLTQEDDVWKYNAWDHVEWGPEQKEEAERQLAAQAQTPVNDFDKGLYMGNPARYWDLFYRNNKEKFFKDRKWLRVEFPALYEACKKEAGPVSILEVGCGAGNTMFPVLQANENPDLKIAGVDFSSRAVEIVKTSPSFDPKFAHAAVWDLADPEGKLPEGIEPNSVDIVVMIFVFSALAPEQWPQAVSNLQKILKPGGRILFRDYGRYDLTQIRFKKGRLLDENFYIRGDGTRVYFFTEEELAEIFGEVFTPVKIATDRRLIVNRQRKLKMYRVWLQAEFSSDKE